MFSCLQNNLERSEFETRSKLEAQIEGLEREATLLRKKLESEENHHEKVVKNWEVCYGYFNCLHVDFYTCKF